MTNTSLLTVPTSWHVLNAGSGNVLIALRTTQGAIEIVVNKTSPSNNEDPHGIVLNHQTTSVYLPGLELEDVVYGRALNNEVHVTIITG